MSTNPSDLFNARPCSWHTRQTNQLILRAVAIASRYNLLSLQNDAAGCCYLATTMRTAHQFRLQCSKVSQGPLCCFYPLKYADFNLCGFEPAGAQTAQRSLEQHEGRWFDLGLAVAHVWMCPWAKCGKKMAPKAASSVYECVLLRLSQWMNEWMNEFRL